MSGQVVVDEPVREFTKGQRAFAFLILLLAFAVVGGAPMVISFSHIQAVALLKHQTPFNAFLYPFAIDGMMVISSVAYWQDSVRGMVKRPWARFAFWLGLTISTAANITSYVLEWGWDVVGVSVAGVTPGLLLVSIEVVTNPSKRRKAFNTVAGKVAAVQHGVSVAADAVRNAASKHPAVDATATVGGGVVADVVAVSSGEGLVSEIINEWTDSTGSAAASGGVRRVRSEDDEPLSPELIALARKVGAAWRERTGREITRDGLRAQIREAGWVKGFSNTTAIRLLAVVRADGEGESASALNGAAPARS